jgi:hypothetical protein
MKFSIWLENNEITQLFPQQEIGAGKFAKVYSTQNPNIVIRVQHNLEDESCDKFMTNPKIQATGGVAKIFDIKMMNERDLFPSSKSNNQVFVTYKEKVDINWSKHFAVKYSDYLKKIYNIPKLLQMMHYGKETAAKIGEVPAFLELAIEAFRTKNLIIDFLKHFSEASGLIKAINMGLPFDDLHSTNLGINPTGHLVVIDC